MTNGWVNRQGFTIVELLIVIVVIAILATITVVAYNGIQDRAKDVAMVTAANQVEKALQIWAFDNGSTILGGSGSTVAAGSSGCTDGSNGFFGSGTYTCTVEDSLVAAKLLPSGFSARLPSNANYNTAAGGRLSIMLYGCSSVGAGSYALYWNLRRPTTQDSNAINSTLTSCNNSVNIRDSWGMRSAKIIQL